MRKIILLMLIALVAASLPVEAVITMKVHGGAGGSGSTAILSGLNTLSSNFLAVSVNSAPGANIILHDSMNNTWTKLPAQRESRIQHQLFYVLTPITNASHTFTVTCETCYPSMEVAGFLSIGDIDKQSGDIASYTLTVSPGSVTPTSDSQLILVGLAAHSATGLSINSGFTILDTITTHSTYYGGSLAYIVQDSAAAVNPTWTASNANYFATTLATFTLVNNPVGPGSGATEPTGPPSDASPSAGTGGTWSIVGMGDFDHNGSPDILWQHPSGAMYIWFLSGTKVLSVQFVGIAEVSKWAVASVQDMNGDGIPDIVWACFDPTCGTDAQSAVWYMNSNGTLASIAGVWQGALATRPPTLIEVFQASDITSLRPTIPGSIWLEQ